ncbi:MAG: hypothetical protein LQ350_003796 [Teloschistes chrysophthalmus]|nr:MAG: hypothetical protein LQ350_003796 [Niorma chrysophthalma]
MADHALVSSDLIWETCRSNNAYLVKRSSGGGSQFSKDPMNLTNKHSRKYDGFVNTKAVGIQPAEKGGVTLITKKKKHQNRPSANKLAVTWPSSKAGPKLVVIPVGSKEVYKGIVNYTAKQNYRADLRQEAVARASAIRQAAREKKDKPEKKARGAKAKAAAEKES